jgi:Superinfection immunity protein
MTCSMLFAASAAGGLVALAVVLGLYFLPSIIGANRKVPNVGSIVVINFFLGWTLIGWVVALAMALRSVPQPASVHHAAATPSVLPAMPVGTELYRECPFCKENMRRDASTCPHCRKESVAWAFNDGFWWVQDPKGVWLQHDEATGGWQSYDPSSATGVSHGGL